MSAEIPASRKIKNTTGRLFSHFFMSFKELIRQSMIQYKFTLKDSYSISEECKYSVKIWALTYQKFIVLSKSFFVSVFKILQMEIGHSFFFFSSNVCTERNVNKKCVGSFYDWMSERRTERGRVRERSRPHLLQSSCDLLPWVPPSVCGVQGYL